MLDQEVSNICTVSTYRAVHIGHVYIMATPAKLFPSKTLPTLNLYAPDPEIHW